MTSILDDDSGCTLREAVASINGAGLETGCGYTSTYEPGIADAVVFASSVSGQTITLTAGQIEVDQTMSINPGGSMTTVESDGSSRLFNIDVSEIDVEMEQLTLTGGVVSGAEKGGGIRMYGDSGLQLTDVTVSNNSAASYGGGISIFEYANVTLTDSTVSANTAYGGGGVYLIGSSLTLSGSSLTNNQTTTADGGGLSARPGLSPGESISVTLSNSTVSSNTISGNVNGAGISIQGSSGKSTVLTINDSTVTGNSIYGNGNGGGIWAANYLKVSLNNSTVSDNTMNFGSGAGIHMSGIFARLYLSGTTVSGNSATSLGGGLFLQGDYTRIENSTISGNRAVSPFNSGTGGGIYASDTNFTLVNSTIADNEAYTAAGGVYAKEQFSTTSVTLINTIVADSSGGQDCEFDGNASITAGDDNIIVDDGCSTSALSSDPALVALADNGGPTLTHALGGGSPAIDAATADNANCGTGTALETDQRGEPRDDGSCDIGAYEVQLVLDFGDAPDGPYPTLLASDGARHEPTGITLGATRDAESDGQPTATADGDGADEDGVIFGSNPSAGFTTMVTVNASASGLLDAWIDFNDDGDWQDPGEQIFTNQSVNSGDNVFNITTPVDATADTTFGRFRVSAAGNLAPTGLANAGEVEDYEITIIDEDTDNDGMTDAYEDSHPVLDKNDPDDADDDDDGDGLDSLEEFNADTDPNDPDSDGDGIGDALDNEPNSSGNSCNNGDDTVVSSLTVGDGDTEQCAAASSITVESGVTIQSGGRLVLLAPVVIFSDGFAVPTGGELEVESGDPTPGSPTPP